MFQFVQKKIAVLGFTAKQQKINHGRWSFGQIICVVKFSIDTISFGAYAFLEANSLEEYMYSIFGIISGVVIILSFITVVFKNDKIFDIIENCEMELTKSKQ